MIELIARINVNDSAREINSVDIPELQKKLKGIDIKCNIDKDSINSIQSQLSTISKNLNINIPKIQIAPNIDSGSVNKSIGSIATIYAEGAKQADVLHRKQELLQQDYDILSAKIKKSKLAIDSIATRDGVNYNKVFTDIMSRDILDENTLGRARDALSAIRKEFQKLILQLKCFL